MFKAIVIVDGYSSGGLYAEICKRKGFKCIHVQSQKTIPNSYRNSFRSDDYLQNFIFNGDVSDLAREVKAYNPVACFPGIESGVELADKLSEALGVLSNGSRLSLARRDKFEMAKVVSSAGVRVPKFSVFDKWQQAEAWVKKEKLHRFVVKPLNSAGTDSVFVCETSRDLQNAMEVIVNKINKLGLVNAAALVQEYIDGPEYAVNAVSFNGFHRFTHIWAYHKKKIANASFVYDWEELLEGGGEREKKIFDYVASVLDALGIAHGASHTEIRFDKNGPALIESAARSDGIANPMHDERTLGFNQLSLTLESWTQGGSIQRRSWTGYKRKNAGINVSLISKKSGNVKSIPGLKAIETLNSFVDARLRVVLGFRVEKTMDIFTSPGTVYLAHKDFDQAWKDYLRIRQIEESEEFFELL